MVFAKMNLELTEKQQLILVVLLQNEIDALLKEPGAPGHLDVVASILEKLYNHE